MKHTRKSCTAVFAAVVLAAAVSVSALAAGPCALDHRHSAYCGGGGCYSGKVCRHYSAYPAKGEIPVAQGWLAAEREPAGQALTQVQPAAGQPAPSYACPNGPDCPYGGVCDQDGVCVYGGSTCLPSPRGHHGGGHHAGHHGYGWGC